MQVIKIKYNLIQVHHTVNLDFTLILSPLHRDGRERYGKYGVATWWIPTTDESGIKIVNNRIYQIVNDAAVAAQILFDKFQELKSLVNHASKFLPEVTEPVVISHTGRYVRGGRHFRRGDNVDAYYPGIRMERFDMPKIISQEKMEEIREAFIQDEIYLHRDTFRVQQLGVKGDRVVVLDILTRKGKKWL